MFENAVIVPPKLENRFNILKTKEISNEQFNTILDHEEQQNQRISHRPFYIDNNQTIEEANLEDTINEENTIVEYSSFVIDLDTIVKNKKEVNNINIKIIFYLIR
jgi:hypothetical protein